MNLGKYKHIVFSVAIGSLLLVGLFLFLNGAPQIARADPGNLFVTPGGSGTACTQASPCDLQTALNNAAHGDTIYIAAGTYTGTGGAVITVTKSIALYGGWDGNTTTPPVRDPDAHPTTMDGEGSRRGVYVSGDITVTLEGFTVTNGVASIKGAGLYANNAHLTLRGMTFYSNVISTTVTGSPYGGGAMVEGGTLQVEASTFRANSVWADRGPTGGGLVISHTLTATVVDSVFRDNDAWSASGLYFWAPYGGGNAPLIIRGSRFVDNGRGNSPGLASGGYYGAMEIVNANARVEDNLVEHNEFGNGRGAVAVFYSDLVVARNIISGNTSYYDASGLYLYHLSSPFTLTNNVIVDNQSTYYWTEHQCVHIRGSDGQMLHNTIARNDNTYGVRIENGAAVALTNTILVSHTVGITVTAGSTATLEGTLWGSGSWANGTDWGGDGDIFTGTVNIWGNPALLDPDGGDYHIGPASAAIDAGVDAGVTDDVDGDTRPQGSGYDIGADEFSRQWDIYLPLVVKNYP
jgi:hypothetical protein